MLDNPQRLRPTDRAWTDERVGALKTLWSEGMSASQIAVELGNDLTRNAVVGKIHRLGLSGRIKKPALSREGKPRIPRPPRPKAKTIHYPHNLRAAKERKARPPMTGEEPPLCPHPEAPPPKMIGILELTSSTCKYPIGHPHEPTFGFCGHDTSGNTPWCDHHRSVVYRINKWVPDEEEAA